MKHEWVCQAVGIHLEDGAGQENVRMHHIEQTCMPWNILQDEKMCKKILLGNLSSVWASRCFYCASRACGADAG